MVKTASDPVALPRFRGAADAEESRIDSVVPAHKDFRVRYFNRFQNSAYLPV